MQNNVTLKLDVIIPVFNSHTTIGPLLDEILSLEFLKRYELGIILVNDASTDSSLAVCNSYNSKHPFIKVLNLSRNYGQHSAIFAGLSKSKADLILTMDDDGQHMPTTIKTLLDQMSDDIDVIYGIPETEAHTRFRNFSSRLLKRILFSMFGFQNARHTSAFRLIRREIFGSVNFESLTSGFLEVVIDWNTEKVKWVSVPMSRRVLGKSNYTFRKLFRMATNMVTSYSTKPLRIATFIGFIGFLLSFGLSCFYLYKAFNQEIQVDGYASLIVLVGLLGSVQLITLGILGEYLGKIHERSTGKPNFFIRNFSGD
jgi:undecaprenyl-phosphate 4-deoxy-4-formamido-L-arabinose transferase